MVDSEDPLLLRPRRRPSAAAMLPRVVLVLVAVQAVFGGNFVVMKSNQYVMNLVSKS